MKMYKKRTLSKWLFRFITISSVIGIYYIIFSVLFDTPIEHELKKSNRTLQIYYNELKLQYDTLQQVLSNLEQRDRGVYRMVYEAEPYSEEELQLKRKIISDEIILVSNKELNSMFLTRLNKLVEQAKKTDVISRKKIKYMLSQKSYINSIPSIQPVHNPTLSLFGTSFGQRINPFYKTINNHYGVDYTVPEGTTVFVTADGVVSNIQSKGASNGLSITVNHKNGYTTTYAHLYKVNAKEGERLRRGDVIALSGNSGVSFAPHLHYEISYKKKHVDPINYMFLELNKSSYEDLVVVASHAMQAFD